MKGDSFQVDATIEVHGGNDDLEAGDYTFDSGDVLLFEGKRDRVEGMIIEEVELEAQLRHWWLMAIAIATMKVIESRIDGVIVQEELEVLCEIVKGLQVCSSNQKKGIRVGENSPSRYRNARVPEFWRAHRESQDKT